jgi:hypothetical protein
MKNKKIQNCSIKRCSSSKQPLQLHYGHARYCQTELPTSMQCCPRNEQVFSVASAKVPRNKKNHFLTGNIRKSRTIGKIHEGQLKQLACRGRVYESYF